MPTLAEIKNAIIKMFPEGALKDTTWEYNFKFNFEKKIQKIAYATNFTPFVINKAAECGADLLITHHDAWPFMKEQREHCEKLLNENQLNHCFFHTPLDAAEFGTSASLADALGITNKKRTLPYFGHLVGVAGNIEKQSFESLVEKCEKILGEKVRSFKNHDNEYSKILVATGGGHETSCLDSAIEENCDTYVTGEYLMYLQHYAEFHKINLIIGSHTKTELQGVRNFVKKIANNFNDLELVEIDEPNY